jgi:hypothetical protein
MKAGRSVSNATYKGFLTAYNLDWGRPWLDRIEG